MVFFQDYFQHLEINFTFPFLNFIKSLFFGFLEVVPRQFIHFILLFLFIFRFYSILKESKKGCQNPFQNVIFEEYFIFLAH